MQALHCGSADRGIGILMRLVFAAFVALCLPSVAAAQTANLWIDTNGGSCTRQSSPAGYNDGSACSSMQAAIAACHARAASAEDTDWTRIVALYDALSELHPTPVVHLNHAVALAMAFGPIAGLEVVDKLLTEPLLRGYHLLPAVRGDLLFKLGRFAEARSEFERAATMTQNVREQELLRERAADCPP